MLFPIVLFDYISLILAKESSLEKKGHLELRVDYHNLATKESST
jgi:hypothetical protein